MNQENTEKIELAINLLEVAHNNASTVLTDLKYELEFIQFSKLNQNNPYKPFIQSKGFSVEFMKWLVNEMNLKGLAQQVALHLEFYTTEPHSKNDNGMCFVFLPLLDVPPLNELFNNNLIVNKFIVALTEIYECPIEVKIISERKLLLEEALGEPLNKIKVEFINEKN